MSSIFEQAQNNNVQTAVRATIYFFMIIISCELERNIDTEH